jgi:hypothetical protein
MRKGDKIRDGEIGKGEEGGVRGGLETFNTVDPSIIPNVHINA